MEIAFLLFDGITPLDAIGPFEVLGKLPGAKIRMVAKEKGEVRTKGQSLAMIADYAFADVAKSEILVVPGGPGADAMAGDGAVTDWLSRAHETTTWTTSVCTGVLILGGAGVLKGLKATTHWRAMDDLAAFGAQATDQRVVRDGKVIAAAGEDIAKAIQLAIEYAPEPPFDAGRYRNAPPDRVERVHSTLNRP
ncbi:MAG: DJ-1/PfpI family protein [Rhodospirillales bacterium]|nr:DJ-1/PfpI family protein [Rhodospirillales bacterium]